jgi:hypothetical protein
MSDNDPNIPATVRQSVVWLRLEDQISWYTGRSARCQRLYKTLKGVQLTLAVLIPVIVTAPIDAAKWIVAIAGAAIAILEGIQHMNQYSTLWVTYRSTAEYLKHDKYLFLSSAGPYKELGPEDKFVVLAERIEERVSAEHANWFNETRRGVQEPRQKGAVASVLPERSQITK